MLELEPLASFEDAEADWEALAPAAGNPYATLPWAAAWWRAYGSGRRLALTRVRATDGRVVALLPLYRAGRGPVQVLRLLGHGPADLLGPVCSAADLPLVAQALRRIARASGRLLLAERLSGDGVLRVQAGGRLLRTEPSPVLALDGGDWEAWLAGRSANLRGQIRRLERRLARDHELVFRRTEDPAQLDADLATLIDLHDRRWAAEGGSDSFSGARAAFHRDFAAEALRRGWLRLWFAEVDGQPVAAWYGLRYGDRHWYYQLGRDPTWDRYRVGFVLLVHTIREAFAERAVAYEFGLGAEAYKARFATSDPGVETVMLGGSVRLALAAGAVRAVQRLPAGARRRVSGRLR